MISDLESLGREVDFEEFLDGITSKLGDKESRVSFHLFRMESIKYSIFLTMTRQEASTQIISEGWPRNWVRL
jgi:hypothetical protein